MLLKLIFDLLILSSLPFSLVAAIDNTNVSSIPAAAINSSSPFLLPQQPSLTDQDYSRSLTCAAISRARRPKRVECMNALLYFSQDFVAFEVSHQYFPNGEILNRVDPSGNCRIKVTLEGGEDSKDTTSPVFVYMAAMMIVTGCQRSEGKLDEGVVMIGKRGNVKVTMVKARLGDDEDSGDGEIGQGEDLQHGEMDKVTNMTSTEAIATVSLPVTRQQNLTAI